MTTEKADVEGESRTEGDSIPWLYPGELRRLPDGTEIGKRDASKSGGPALDVWHPSGRFIMVRVAKEAEE